LPQKTYNKYLQEHPDYEPYLEINQFQGWIPKPLFNGYHYGVHNKLANLRHNIQGFRNDREFTLENIKHPRVMFIGDSFTYGWGVNQEDTFQYLIEKQIGGDMINLGVPNYETDMVLARFDHHYKNLNPDIIVYGFFPNDFFAYTRDKIKYRRDCPLTIKTPVYYQGKTLASKDFWEELDKPINISCCNWLHSSGIGFSELNKKCNTEKSNIQQNPLKRSALYLALSKFLEIKSPEKTRFLRGFSINFFHLKEGLFTNNTRLQEGINNGKILSYHIIRLMNKTLAEDNKKFVLVYLPDLTEVSDTVFKNHLKKYNDVKISDFDVDRPSNEFAQFAKDNNIQFVNLVPIFRSHKNPEKLYGRFDNHFSEKGHELVTDTLKEAINNINK